MTISVIVPVYNCEETIRTCIESLVVQAYEQLEIILVDDGSTDESPMICEEFAETDSRIKVIHKENGGVSSARNAGLIACTGDYVLFLDADDWLDDNACEKIISSLDNDTELFVWNAKVYENERYRVLPDILKRENLPEFAADIIISGKGQNTLLRASWAKVYKRSILQGLSFSEDLYIGEDGCFLLQCIGKINSISQIKVINDAWYNYHVHASSATQKYKTDLFEQSCRQLSIIEEELAKLNMENLKCVQTALTVFSWQIYFNLKVNSMKYDNNGCQDCYEWRRRANAYLKNRKIYWKRLSKFKFICWLLDGILPNIILEKIVELYTKSKREQYKI